MLAQISFTGFDKQHWNNHFPSGCKYPIQLWFKITWGLYHLVIVELAERNPIIIQNSSNPSSQKNLDVRLYDCMTVQGATFNMCTAGTPMPWLCPVVQWSVHWAPSQMTQVLVLAGPRHCALEMCGKKMRAPLLALAKSIY